MQYFQKQFVQLSESSSRKMLIGVGKQFKKDVYVGTNQFKRLSWNDVFEYISVVTVVENNADGDYAMCKARVSY